MNNLAELKLTEITALYNEFAAATGAKPVKGFRDKPTAIKRTLEIQEQAAEPEETVQPEAPVTDEPEAPVEQESEDEEVPSDNTEEAKEAPVKAPTAKPKPANSFSMNIEGERRIYDIDTTKVLIVKRTEKSDTIIAELIAAIDASLDGTVAEVAEHIVTNYSRPKSAKQVDRPFVIRKIKRAVQKGYLKLDQRAD